MKPSAWLAGSLVVLMLAAPNAAVMAYQQGSPGNLQLVPPDPNISIPATLPANQYVTNEDVSLRGRVTAIPKGTMMMVKLDRPVTTFSGKTGDAVSATVEADVFSDGMIVVPAGSTIEGAITGVTPAGRIGKNGAIEIQFNLIKTQAGATIPIRAHVVTADNTGVIKGDTDQARVFKTLGSAAGITGAGTLMGTAVGGLLSSVGPGAVFGVAAGGAAGIGYAMLRKGKQVELPVGARMSIVLDQQVAFN